MTPTDYWDDGPTLDDGLGRGTVRPAPLQPLAPGWERVVTPGGCTGGALLGVILVKCGRPAPYANPRTHEWSCVECADLHGVFPEAGGDGGISP